MTNENKEKLTIKQLLLDIKKLLENNTQDLEYTDDEPYVTIKLKLNDDKLKLLINEYKIYSLLQDLLNFKRELYKYGCPNKEIIVKDNKVIDRDTDRPLTQEDLKGRKCYIEEAYIVDKLEDLLDGAYEILNDRY